MRRTPLATTPCAVCVCVQAEKARKNAEAELSDSSSHVTEINIVMQNLTNDKHRLEGDMVMMRQQLDDAVTARRAAEERSERLGIEVAYYYYYYYFLFFYTPGSKDPRG